jgi:hypothetical protein
LACVRGSVGEGELLAGSDAAVGGGRGEEVPTEAPGAISLHCLATRAGRGTGHAVLAFGYQGCRTLSEALSGGHHQILCDSSIAGQTSGSGVHASQAEVAAGVTRHSTSVGNGYICRACG